METSGGNGRPGTKKRGGNIRQERFYSRYFRSLPLPGGVIPDTAEVTRDKGVLEATIPKGTPCPEQRETRVPVKWPFSRAILPAPAKAAPNSERDAMEPERPQAESEELARAFASSAPDRSDSISGAELETDGGMGI